MITKKKKVATPHTSASLEEPLARRNFEELITVTRHQVDAIKGAPDYLSTPTVQAAVATLGVSTDAFDDTVAQVGQKKAELAVLLGTREAQYQTVLRDRSLLRGVITNASQGSPEGIKAWRCLVKTTASPLPTQDPPEQLALKNSKATPGAILAKCKAVRGAGSYVFAITTDPNAPPGAGQTLSVTTCKCELPVQPLGHIVYVRVSVVRKRGGAVSRWSDVAQILVR